MRVAEVFEDAPCVGRPWLWDSTDWWDHQAAAAECHKCPAIDACRNLLAEVQGEISPAMRAAGGGCSGTWAGELVGKSEPTTGPACGSDAGYYRHRRQDETPCEDCWEAHSVAESARYSRRRALRMGGVA
jgi:hypothetical protein